MTEPANRDAARGHTTVRVRYPETDRMGVAYHAHYLVWFELGRTELMRDMASAYGDLEENRGIYFPVVRVEARYLEPARYDDILEVSTRLTRVGGARVRFEYAIARQGSKEVLATGFTEHAAVGRDGRPKRLPAELRRRLQGTEGQV